MAPKASSVSRVMNSTTVDSERETLGAPVLGGDCCTSPAKQQAWSNLRSALHEKMRNKLPIKGWWRREATLEDEFLSTERGLPAF